MPIVTISLWKGRNQDQKKELAEIITKEMARVMNAREETIQVIYNEIDKENWSIGGKIPDK